MSAQYGTRHCDRCGQPIKGPVQKVPVFSASGARPDAVVHPKPAGCPPRRRTP